MTIIVLTAATFTPEAAIDWLTERGATRFVLWRGADGMVRGHGVRS